MRRARGQAAVEFALGSLVFVTVLLFGIHFAEVGYLSAKVHEAGAAAMWDATAYRSYSFGVTYDAAPVAAASPGFANGAGNRYLDWDGRTSHAGSAPKMVMTQAQPMAVNCVDNRGTTSFGLPAFAPQFGEPGGVSCTAQGDFGFAFMRMPNKFAEGATGFFKAPHNSKIGTPTTLCSSGRAASGTCKGTLSVLLGDDSLNDGNPGNSVECDLLAASGAGTCANPRFYQVTRAAWDRSMQLQAGWGSGYTGVPENWAQAITTGVPGGEITGFYMSFRGGGAYSGSTGALGWNFFEPQEAAKNGGNWQSSPMDAQIGGVQPYLQSYKNRNNCAGGSTSLWTAGHGYCYLGKFPCGD